jgi:hypothetical protein
MTTLKPLSERVKTFIFAEDIHSHELLSEKLIAPMKSWEDARDND